MKATTYAAIIAIMLAAPVHAQSKSITWGNSLVGATATATSTAYIPAAKNSCSFYNTGRVDGKLLYMSKNLASGAANFSFAPGSLTSNASGTIKIGSNTLASWNKTFVGSGAFSTDPLLGIERGGNYTIIPGVLSVGATASVNVRAEMLSTVTPSNGRQTMAGIYADIAASGNGTVSLWPLSGGLAGKMTLCKTGLVASADMKRSADALKPNSHVVTCKADFLTQSPAGSIEAWWKRVGGSRHAWKIVNFTGTTNTYNLASGSFELTSTPILR